MFFNSYHPLALGKRAIYNLVALTTHSTGATAEARGPHGRSKSSGERVKAP